MGEPGHADAVSRAGNHMRLPHERADRPPQAGRTPALPHSVLRLADYGDGTVGVPVQSALRRAGAGGGTGAALASVGC